MKRIVIYIIVIIVSFVGCGVVQDKYKGGENMNVKFRTGTYHNKKWDETIGTYQNDVIPNKDVALNVAVQIFEGMQKSDNMQSYVPQSIFFDEEDNVWVVSFWEQSKEPMLGGGCSIAIQKKDGKILRIWFGE